MQFQVKDWVVVLYGTAKKWDINAIKLRATTPQGIFFDASCPALMFNRAEKKPFMLTDADEFLTNAGRPAAREELSKLYSLSTAEQSLAESTLEILKREVILLCGDDATKFERRFVELYFDRLLDDVHFAQKMRKYYADDAATETKIAQVFTALLPIPQAQFYCHDPLQPRTFIPENNFRVDFGFWTGTDFYAVEIDGREPEGYAADVRKDRLLRRAGVDLIHILNTEIMEHSKKIIHALLPTRVLENKDRAGSAGPRVFNDDIPF